jgi:hypothetical protein
VLLDTKPFRVWRSTSPTSQTLDFDFGAAVTVAGIYLDHCNFTTATYHAAATIGATTDALGARTTYVEELTQRRKALHLVTMSTPRQFLRLAISGVTGGDAFAELGGLTFVTAAGMAPIGYSFGFPEYGQAQDIEQLAVAAQVSARGRPYARIGLGQPHIRRGAVDVDLAHFRTLIARAKVTPHLYSENRETDGDGTTRHAWLGLIEGAEQRHVITKVTFSPETLTFREVIE